MPREALWVFYVVAFFAALVILFKYILPIIFGAAMLGPVVMGLIGAGV